MSNSGSGSGIGGVGGGRPPQRPSQALGNKPLTDKMHLVTCLSQKLVDLLGARGFTVRQYGDVVLFREREIEYAIRLQVKKGEETGATIAIFDKSSSLFIYEKNMTEAEELKLVESLKGVLIGEAKKTATHYYWLESGLMPLLDKYQTEIQDLAAKPIPELDGPWARPAAIPAKITNGSADTLPHLAAQESENKPGPKTVSTRLTSGNLAAALNKYLSPHGFKVIPQQGSPSDLTVNITREGRIIATLKISDDYGTNLIRLPSSARDDLKKIIRLLENIMPNPVTASERYYYWGSLKIEAMTQRLQPDLQALEESRPSKIAINTGKQETASIADTLPEPPKKPSSERTTKPFVYVSTLIRGKGKEAKLLFNSEHLASALREELAGVQQIAPGETKPGAQNAIVEISIGDSRYRLSVSPLIASLSCLNHEMNDSLVETLASIFGKFEPRPGRKAFVCNINWLNVETQLGKQLKLAMIKIANDQPATPEKIAMETTAPGPMMRASVPGSVSATANTAPIKIDYETSVKKWAEEKLVDWLSVKFPRFNLNKLDYSFSAERLTIIVKAIYQVRVPKEIAETGVADKAMHISLSIGEFGTFVRQVIPDRTELHTLQEIFNKFGRSKLTSLALHYANFTTHNFQELIGYNQTDEVK